MQESTWKESHIRSIFKALSWRVWATLTTIVISYAITGNLNYAISIGSIEVFAKIGLFYLHERMWARFFHFGFRIKSIKRRTIA